MNKKNHVVIWADGYLNKTLASNEKNRLLAELFSNCNSDCTFSCKKFHPNWQEAKNNEIIFFNTKSNFSLSYFTAILKEIKYLKSLRLKYEKVLLLVSYTNILLYLFYSITCRLFNVKLVLNIMEWHIAQVENKRFLKKINPFLFDNFSFRLSNGAITISDFISEKLWKQSKLKPIIKIPVLADIKLIDAIIKQPKISNKYFAYCGNIGYKEVVDIIVKAYEIFVEGNTDSNYDLILILNGDKKLIQNFEKKIKTLKIGIQIHIFSNLEFSELIGIYKNAEILLIPLRNINQDKARYPHKIGEYSICSKPIISNKIGQVGTDFEHLKNIYFSKDYSAEFIAQSIFSLINDKELMKKLSINARLNGEKIFNKENYIIETEKFLEKI